MPDTGQVQDPTPSIGSEAAGPESFERLVLERSRERPVVVDFWADWCGPCRALAPVLEREIEATDGGVELVKVDVDAPENLPLAERFGIRGIPAVKAFRGGTVVAEFTGAQPPPAVQSFLEQLTAPPAAERIAAELRETGELPEVLAALDAGELERALELLLDAVHGADAEGRERIRGLMVALFADLGSEHPVAAAYRRRLATVLF
jgi:putative thioredoxin